MTEQRVFRYPKSHYYYTKFILLLVVGQDTARSREYQAALEKLGILKGSFNSEVVIVNASDANRIVDEVESCAGEQKCLVNAYVSKLATMRSWRAIYNALTRVQARGTKVWAVFDSDRNKVTMQESDVQV